MTLKVVLDRALGVARNYEITHAGLPSAAPSIALAPSRRGFAGAGWYRKKVDSAVRRPSFSALELWQNSLRWCGSMSKVDLFLFDLDGTVTREELLPRIARAIGEEQAIADLTRRTIAGDVPFESSLRERVKILGKANVTEVAEIVANVELEPKIEDFLKKNAHRSYIVTGNLDVWLTKLAERLPVPILCSKARAEGDRIVGLIDVLDKGQAVRSLGNGRFCAVGEGHNDLGMFEASAFSVAYGGVHDPAPGLNSVATHAIYNPETLCRLLLRL